MATLNLFRHRFYNNDGTLAAGGKVYTYQAGTSTLTNTYTDSSASTANTNPIILDAKGEADIWVNSVIKVNLLQSDDVQVTGWPVDNINTANVLAWNDRGNFDASVNTYPTTGGSGASGAILTGDLWTISVVATSGPLNNQLVGTTVRALTDTPAQTAGNWQILDVGLGASNAAAVAAAAAAAISETNAGTSETNASTSASNAATSETNAGLSEAAALAYAQAMSLNSTQDTSASSVAIGTGAKTFAVSAGKSFVGGMFLVIADTAAPSTNSMYGQITSYSGTTLVMNVLSVLGSGTKTAWTISQTSAANLNVDSAGTIGTFTATGVGFSGTAPTTTASYLINNGYAHIHMTYQSIAGTSNSTGFSITGLPAALQLAARATIPITVIDGATDLTDGNIVTGEASITTGTITLRLVPYANTGGGTATWTASGTKSLITTELVYKL